jgi:hypothetical protein
VPPTPPTELVVPEILKANDGQPVDFLAKMKETARPALFRGRGNEQLDQEVMAAFAGIGIQVAFRSAPQLQELRSGLDLVRSNWESSDPDVPRAQFTRNW